MLSVRTIVSATLFATFVLSSPADGGFLSEMSDSFWTYVVLGLSSIVTEELSAIFGGIAAHEGELQLERVILALTFGGWFCTALLYAMGRLKWDVIRRRWPRTRATGTVALRVVSRNPVTASFLVRMAFGLRLVLPLACGAARVPFAIYITASLLGSAVWSTIFTLLGYAAGEAAVQVVGRLGRVGEVVGAVVVTALVALFVRWRRRRDARKAARRERGQR
jgi:membrane protein DedA with SNARE-associated domain